MPKLRYALGVDGGGSKCDAVLIREDGTVAGWGRGGPTHHWYDPADVIARSFADAVTMALADVRNARMWVAGHFHSPLAWEAIELAGEVVGRTHPGEVDVAYASALVDHGLVVLSGTGSFVHLRTRDGEGLHAGGLGPVLGDYGSGYDVGLRGLRAAFAEQWLESRRTSLRDAIPAALGVPDTRHVFHMVYNERSMNRRRIASLARTVNQEAEAGDEIARRCVLDAADALADFAVEVLEQVGVNDEQLPVIASGSVAQNSRLWWERMCERIREVAPRMKPIIPRVRPAVGAALTALREMGVEVTPQLVDRIVETQQAPYDAAQKAVSNT